MPATRAGGKVQVQIHLIDTLILQTSPIFILNSTSRRSENGEDIRWSPGQLLFLFYIPLSVDSSACLYKITQACISTRNSTRATPQLETVAVPVMNLTRALSTTTVTASVSSFLIESARAGYAYASKRKNAKKLHHYHRAHVFIPSYEQQWSFTINRISDGICD